MDILRDHVPSDQGGDRRHCLFASRLGKIVCYRDGVVVIGTAVAVWLISGSLGTLETSELQQHSLSKFVSAFLETMDAGTEVNTFIGHYLAASVDERMYLKSITA